MHTLHLNIGLNPSNNYAHRSTIRMSEVEAQLLAAGFSIVRMHEVTQRHAQGTELTAMITCTSQYDDDKALFNNEGAIYNISKALSQDCIAWTRDGKDGRLTGPHAADWGEFNPEYFLVP